ncbi:MAG: hypothetical protein PHC92_00215 [Syntrophomonadaceae bacterium]|nr:hypothetical protein [Syntrophomonadaceae bacterium]MDD3024934.1 hypothetical protein [Syntrophomonadaceae bacterium]
MVQGNYGYARVLDTEIAYEQDSRIKKVRRTVKKVDGRKSLLLKSSMGIFLIALIIVYLCMKSSTLGYQIVSLENDISKLETAKQQMEYQIAQKSSLQRIENVALNELGMCKPARESSFTVMLASTNEPVELVHSEKTSSEGKSLERIYASLTRLVAMNN